MPLSWRKKVLLARTEVTYGTDPTPTGTADAVLATNVEITPMDGSDVSRDLELPYFGAQATIPAELRAKITFNVEFAPSGVAGNVPAWGTLLRACGVAEVVDAGASVTYNPVTDGHESVTIWFNVDGILYAIPGARGTAKINVTAQAVPRIEFEFTGLYQQPVAAAAPAVNLNRYRDPQLGTSANTTTFTVGGVPLVMRTAVLDLANSVEARFLIGSESVLITDRNESFETTVEAVAPATFNPFARAANQAKFPIQLVHGTGGAGRVMTLDIPTAQMQRPQGLANSQNIVEWPLRMVPLPDEGNDQWTLTIT